VSQKEKGIILIALIICILGYGYYSFYLTDQLKDMKKVKAELNNLKTEVINIKTHKNTIDQETADAKNHSKKLDEAIPDSYNKRELVMYFYNLINEKGLECDNIRFGQNEKSNNYVVNTASFIVKGNYENIKDFISTIENNTQKFTISQITAAQNNGDTSNASMTVELYSLKGFK
jgi:Tfp pilus assembly protein PilO